MLQEAVDINGGKSVKERNQYTFICERNAQHCKDNAKNVVRVYREIYRIELVKFIGLKSKNLSG